MVDFSEDVDIEQGLFEKRMKQKGGKGRRMEENQAVVPLSLMDRVQGQLTPNTVSTWLVTVLSAFNLKQQNICKKYMCRYTHAYTHICIVGQLMHFLFKYKIYRTNELQPEVQALHSTV